MASLKGPGEAAKFDAINNTIEGSSLRVAIVHARWNTTIITSLVTGAKKAMRAAGVKSENIIVETVPGSYELPLAVQRIYQGSQSQSSSVPISATDLLSASTTDLVGTANAAVAAGPFDAIIAIGVLIKGETMHFEYIADAVSHGLMRVQLDSGVPVVFGLLTALDEEQALVRAGLNGGHNHGEDWGNVAVELGCKRKIWAEGKFS
ncbi:MAG: hypothetical protein M1834_003684 [Cirrosporium novae-zelandiae]|nr:MAG: hypothetical protein M1834_003684 [Cirrosporium novae-zelandiae]